MLMFTTRRRAPAAKNDAVAAAPAQSSQVAEVVEGIARQASGLGREAAELVLRQISQTAREMARLLQVEAGSGPDAEAILAQAHQRLLTMTIPPAQAGQA